MVSNLIYGRRRGLLCVEKGCSKYRWQCRRPAEANRSFDRPRESPLQQFQSSTTQGRVEGISHTTCILRTRSKLRKLCGQIAFDSGSGSRADFRPAPLQRSCRKLLASSATKKEPKLLASSATKKFRAFSVLGIRATLVQQLLKLVTKLW